MKIRLRTNKSQTWFLQDYRQPNFSLGTVDCPLCTRHVRLNDDFDTKRLHMLTYTPLELKYLEILEKTFIIPARQNQFFQENVFNNAPVCPFAFAMVTNYAFAGSYTKSPFCYQQFDLQKFRLLRGGQPIVDFDAADKCRFYATTMKAMNFQIDIPSIPTDNIRDHYVAVLPLTSMEDATDSSHYPELVGGPLRLELNFTFPLEPNTELILLGEGMSLIACDKFGVVGKNI